MFFVDTPRLKTRLFIQALICRCEAAGLSAFRLVRGDPDSGMVYLKLNGLGAGFIVLAPIRDGTGREAWLRATGPDPVDESGADAYLDQQRRFDRDLWVIEIETRTFDVPLDAPSL